MPERNLRHLALASPDVWVRHMRPVCIVGIGQIPVGVYVDRSLGDMARSALAVAMQDAGLESIPAVYVSALIATQPGKDQAAQALLADVSATTGAASVSLLAASGGAAALHTAVTSVAAGTHETLAVVGVYKTDAAPAADSGNGEPALAPASAQALVMRRYMYEYSWQHEHFAAVVINARRNAAGNSNALRRQPLGLQEYLQAPVVAEPLNALDEAPVADGAAAVIICPAEMAVRFGKKVVHVVGSAMASEAAELQDRADILWPQAMYDSAHAAYAQGECSPQDIDLFEPHDSYSIMAALSLETAGFAEKGSGLKLAQDGSIGLGGRIPLCTLGGLMARGRPLAATGLYQAAEAALQVRGEAGANQVDGARRAMVQSVCTGGGCAATLILRA
jgi:acetyl-CoA C-acetyltransferase